MNEMRRDPVTRKWVIVDSETPVDQVLQQLQSAVEQDFEKWSDEGCPFCPGAEQKTPPSIVEMVNDSLVYHQQSPEWQIRVMPNHRPVFRIEGALNRRLVASYDVMDAVGAHEMIIEHRQHVDWDAISKEEATNILRVYRERFTDLSKDDRFGHLFLFKNYGPAASGRLLHPHSTLIASPSVPERIRRELHYTRRHFQMKERCLFCDIMNEESRTRNHHSGVVRSLPHYVIISPYFAAHPFETWILPRRHGSNFWNTNPESIPELAAALQENLRLVKKTVGRLSYSLLLFTRPNKVWGEERDYWSTIDEDYHWHFKFIPRFPKRSGFHRSFSAGSGYMINQIPPEIAAEILRNQT